MSMTSLRMFVTGFKKDKSIQRHHILMTDADYNYILHGIERQETIDFEQNVSVNSDEE